MDRPKCQLVEFLDGFLVTYQQLEIKEERESLPQYLHLKRFILDPYYKKSKKGNVFLFIRIIDNRLERTIAFLAQDPQHAFYLVRESALSFPEVLAMLSDCILGEVKGEKDPLDQELLKAYIQQCTEFANLLPPSQSPWSMRMIPYHQLVKARPSRCPSPKNKNRDSSDSSIKCRYKKVVALPIRNP
jgi:hypothetical protein